jgi:putative two-component system response regulator
VDDEAPNRRLFTALLTRDGHKVDSAADGAAALAAVESGDYDLILLDIQMPGLGGFEVCRHLKELPRTRLIPIVMVTGCSAREDRIYGIQAGADDFLTKPVDSDELKARVSSLVRVKRYTDQLESAEAIILSLAQTVEARDAYTSGHCERLAHYSTRLGASLGLGTDELAALHRGAFLHDIGKIGIPDAILLKTDRLTESEYEQMKQHTVIGDRLCGTLHSLELVRPIVRHHHERLDGTGYPDGLRGSQVPLLAQIVNIVDTYDAITTDRPYRPGRAAEVAYAELAEEVKRGWRNPALVDAFIALGRRGGFLLPANAVA